ncbi:MAG TPA: hypothetical protein VF789_07545 [Thermoanaerobaculia bacterium]
MALHVKAWAARLFGSSGELMYLPFDKDFRENDPSRNNRIAQSRVGQKPYWYIFVDFPQLDPHDPDYPHYVEVHDNDDFATLKFGAHWSERSGVQQGYGPVPTDAGRHRVRLVLLNREQKPLLSQSGDYYIEIG